MLIVTLLPLGPPRTIPLLVTLIEYCLFGLVNWPLKFPAGPCGP